MAGIVVWEWQNEYSTWRPYDAKICAFLEANKNSTIPLHLGSVDPNLYLYEVDVQMMCQIRQGTGTKRAVRRTSLPSSSPLAKGICWQWEGDVFGVWNDFDIEITEYLDECFVKSQTFVDLSNSKFNLPYHIDLTNNKQTRLHTGRVRNIRRFFTSQTYPKDLCSPGLQTGVKRQKGGGLGSTNDTSKQSRTTTLNVAAASGGIAMASQQPHLFVTQAGLPATFPQMINSSSNPFSYGQSQGPVTRSRNNQTVLRPQGHAFNPSVINHTLNTTMSVSQPIYRTITPSQYVTPVQSQQQSLVPQNMSSFVPYALNSFRPNLIHSGNMQPAVGLYGGAHSVPVPSGSQFHGFSSGSSMYPTFASMTPNNPGFSASLLSAARPSRVRPSTNSSHASAAIGQVPATSSHLLPRYDRISNFPSKCSKKGNKFVPLADDILQNYVTVIKAPPNDEDCCICCEKLCEASGHGNGVPEDLLVLKLEKCSHMFHKVCLVAMYDNGPKDGSLQCPTCKTIYGEKMGNCPKGEMEYKVIDIELPGYPGSETIQILYHIHNGIQGPEHPRPGQPYTARGFPRVGYLPDCDKGRKALQLLIVAWKRRLTFTIGRSTTTGEDHTVTWNEIHHKTELGGNYTGHGYPDPKYLDNVLNELSVHGITEKDLQNS